MSTAWYICSYCGDIEEKPDYSGMGSPCSTCRPMRWMSRVKSEAGRHYMERFHGRDLFASSSAEPEMTLF